ncbi:plasmid mobilization protein [Carboxylicivirga linearis]|uniref:Plasmid mobilization relaxosome protein MobC n=1 Tax=Carboxylicivirga linearis TaxID=1628157 RepID=A0ABS5K299_9BACT|nr:plasmid mobilization relaxosome protein MobC [Carboxylicivirga linearis]MBS2101292.1 plasmid mobilization relaxosome protein MobC [Carboxylicivirga linearis]
MRPKTSEEDALITMLVVRITKQEKSRLEQQFKKERYCSLSEFVRERIFRKRLSKHIDVSDEFYTLFRTLDYDLVKLGTNLNQVAHKLNAYNTYMLKREDMEVIRSCLDVLKECHAVLSKHLILMDLK